MRGNITIEAPKIPKKLGVKYKKMLECMPPGQRDIYCMAVCGICRTELNRSELEWAIDNKFIPVCDLHREETQERIKKLWGQMDQLSLL